MTATTVRWTLAICGLAFAGLAGAQYKSIGPDGTVTYSDLPPPPTSRILNEKKPVATTAVAPLPFAVQNAASKYPVVLYTGDRCAPCDSARNYLRGRGVPFDEKTVTTDDDIALFRSQSPDGTAPVVTIGSRKLVGFSQTQWGSLLDSAGYPAQSVLPAGYQYPLPTPLSQETRVAAQPVAPTTDTGARPAAPQTQPSTTPNAPPGFRF